MSRIPFIITLTNMSQHVDYNRICIHKNRDGRILNLNEYQEYFLATHMSCFIEVQTFVSYYHGLYVM